MIILEDVIVKYGTNPVTIALNKISLKINQGDWITIVGSSGSGKSTLLNVVGGLLPLTSGAIQISGLDLAQLNNNEIQELRRNTISYIYQDFKLFNQYTVLENIIVPQLPYQDKKNLITKAKHLLTSVNLDHRTNHFPTQLSGGEKQRVAIARALLSEPAILLCDEPTGNLDSENTDVIMQLIKATHSKGITILFVTHDQKLIHYGNQILTMRDGNIKEHYIHETNDKKKSYK
ncbi:hypothetical protein AJ85_08045 [Alkalihalobacillus alcalophilus ATCC 27647 = CGMCC 1.3604]|uniref:ABC transporter ATP-binding protein n=1 Tax=Alkalihalobacillus alcalophilus ATCC 27647 = CGMCC 1.3604 TaxID=1218173 RepID=J8TSA7_ALKAL|nr:ABC transporter ATP-binding protein [Alkalihalobacillus alcalophilus]AFV25753.1 efflux transporter [Alkalihalobacillus alcalophilus ATCC 27647 = CGMCC 1.3604]KGA97540.1 ABC transporter ATP-binding protein [Alkalihalobacillus alcalophilus ATCC 27647 = CGMCC 1.3604]MED1560795.1 ABC transporter ATP-binding protein [Alkalihalobacillus alcalophilus]THG90939.1 hypothetical protein AJ85_08045 [Alkalihalobacillus alcalophilus ATCC 27647 = CGMCC 1.3604]